MTIDLSGVFAPITTPFEDEMLAMDRLRENLRVYKQTPLAGFFALGSNGECKSLDENELLGILEVVAAEKGKNQLIMAGGGRESTRQTIALCRQLAGAGADMVSVLTPSYFKKAMTDDAVIRYYRDVADALSVPVVVYNAPGFTGLEISSRALGTISRHPNIIGMKDSSPFDFGKYLEACDDHFQLLSGSISALFSAVTLGAVGGVASLANAFPRACCRFFEKTISGDWAGARRLHFTLSRLNTLISVRFGIAGMKFALDVAGLAGGLPRRPLLPLNTAAKKTIETAITTSGVLEMETETD